VQIFARAFWAQKAGNAPGEYEDAYWPRDRLDQQSGREFRFAVADGATETSYSGIWAKQLVRMFCSSSRGTSPKQFVSDLRCIQRRWNSVVRRRPLPWYAEEKVRAGAFSALLGLRLFDDDSSPRSGAWQASALGDSCLVHLRGDEVLQRFPIESAREFTNRPVLLSSNPEYNDSIADCFRLAEGRWISDDAFYLMTDALAAWFLAQAEQGERPWSIIRDLDTCDQANEFADVVSDLRTSRLLRNDDVTLIRIDVLS
jgi:hypothetical protein